MQFSCPSCSTAIRVKEKHLGKRVVCLKCREIVRVPETISKKPVSKSSAPAPKEAAPVKSAQQTAKKTPAQRTNNPQPTSKSAPEKQQPRKDPKPKPQPRQKKKRAATSVVLTPERATSKKPPNRAKLIPEILNSFRGEIEPVKVSFGYRFGILLASFFMVLLPLLYVVMIGLAGFGVYYHTAYNTGLVGAGSTGKGKVFGLLLYLAPVLSGVILVLFMLKPFFSRPSHRSPPLTLSPEDEPGVFDFVSRICDAVGAPYPQEIVVDCDVNASASFREGMLSMLGNDLRLTIGLPLVAGLSIQEFGGVLAHEFGHFAQGAGMRLTFFVRSISFWFTRVVYERDMWDYRLEQWAHQFDLRISWILHLARLFIWITRRLLWVLMMLGNVVAGFLLRQMEFDADRYEARLAGSDTFEVTCRRITILSVATNGAHSDLNNFYQEGRLADNLPRLVMANVEHIPPQARRELNKQIDQTPTGLFDTHPSNRDRIQSAKREQAHGIFHREEPASILFKDFTKLSRKATRTLYKETFGADLKKEKIHPVEDLLERQQEEMESFKALDRYFQGAFHPLRPLQLQEWHIREPKSPKSCISDLKDSRQKMRSSAPKAKRAYKNAEKKNQSSVFLDVMDPRVEPFEYSSAKRLYAALQLLFVPDVNQKIEHVQHWQHEAQFLLDVLSVINRQLDAMISMAVQQGKLGELLTDLEGNENDQDLIHDILKQMEKVETTLCAIRDRLVQIDYPFDHAAGAISVGKVIVPELPDPENPFEVYQAADAVIDTLPKLFARLVGRLCIFAEKSESAIGLHPLQAPV